MVPFSGNVTPVATWTAANFTANATEWTAYDEATRVAYVEAAASSQSITNSASKADFTSSSDTQSVWGAGLISVSTKSAVTGSLLGAAKFGAVRSLDTADVLSIGYTISLS